jgi:hypothetical protein
MFQTSRFKVVFLCLITGLMAWNSGAQAPLNINGATDRQVINNTATISVPSTGGYTYLVLLDGQPIPTDLSQIVNRMDYHEVFVSRTNVFTGAVTNRLVRFIIRSSNRGSSETGLIEWLPYPTIDSTAPEFAGAQLTVITPEDYPLGLEIPVVAWVENDQGKAVRANATLTAPGQPSIRIRRGVGSGYLPAAAVAGSLQYPAAIPGLTANKTINVEPATTWTPVAGTLNGAVTWANNSRISVTSSITIAPGSTLTVGEGTVVRLNAGVEILVRGQLTVRGTSERPVVFTPLSRAQPWGGIITTSAFPARIDATGAFFVGSGANQDWFDGDAYDTHLDQQACVLLDGATGNFTNCFFLDGRGQVGHGRNANLTLEHSLAQRFLTGGEYVGGTIILNRSAFIEFPQEDGIVNPTIAEADNDAIYFTTGTHILTDTLIGWCKDDGVDSGSGGAGTVRMTNCWVESALHEALAWSGTSRQTWTYDTVLINNGQGIEAGWSGNANSPICFAGQLLSLGNSVGARYGDNYEGTSGLGLKDGFLTVTNSLILHNYRDVWGQPWDGTWNYRAADMDIHDNLITQANSFHPDNSIWNPAMDAARLTRFMTTPPEATVGIGLAVWTDQFAMSTIFQGVPVRLSGFTTNTVTVNYAWVTATLSVLSSGTLTFTPGETVKRVYPAGIDAASVGLARLVVSNPVGGEITGVNTVTFQGTVAAPLVSLAVTGGTRPGYRILEGTFVRLDAPSAQEVTVNYTNRGDGQVLSTGTLVFTPPETLKQLVLTGANPFDYSSVEVSLGSPVNATLSGFTSITYVNPPLTVSFGVTGSQVDSSLLSSGLPVALNGPASSGVSVDFRVEGAGGILTNGTLAFGPGQGMTLLTAPTINLDQHELLRVTLSNPTGAQLASPSDLYLVKVVSAPASTNVTLIARGATWKYRATASDPGATWRNTNYNDASWPAGPAQLGFSNGEEGDEATLIPDNNQITSYFRRTFDVANPAAFTNLSMWLLRDDAGVVHLNGREIFRSPNLPAFPTAIGYATTSSSPNGENTIDLATIAATNLWVGSNWLAVEIHQQAPDSSDVSFNFELIGNAAPLPPPPQNVYFGFFNPGQLTIAWGDASFRLERTDELNGANTVWESVPGTSPITVNYDRPQRFYRIIRP